MTTKRNSLAKVGDVIISPKFAFGRYSDEDKDFVIVDGKTRKYPVMYHLTEDERVAIAAKSGKIPPKSRTVELGAYDPSRAIAKFVVEKAVMEGGGRGQNDYICDGWHVLARRLNEDGSYDSKGEAIGFYMTGDFSNMVEPEDVKVVGKMQKRFI